MPCGLYFLVTDWQEWAFGLDVPKGHEDGDKFVQAATKDLELKAPPGHQYSSAKFNFKSEKLPNGEWLFRLKPRADVDGNVISIEEFLEHSLIQPLVEGPGAIIDAIDYYQRVYKGKELEAEEAFKLSAEMDYAKKPPSQRPGKRAKPEPTSIGEGSGSAPPTPAKSTKSNA